MTQFAFNGRDANGRPAPPFFQCVAVSTSPDPLGTWYLYSWESTATLEGIKKFNDYGKLGVWPDGYYLTLNQFINRANGTSSGAGQGLVVFRRDQMLAGNPNAQLLYWDFDPTAFPTYFSMLPGDLDGQAPPTGEPNHVARFWDGAWGTHPDSILLSKVVVDWATPSNSLFFAPAVLNVNAFDASMCNFVQACIPQAGTTNKVDALSDRLMWRMQYRNFGTHQTFVLNHTVDENSADHAGIRWYELRNTGSGWSVRQQSTYAPDALHRWMGSVAMDRDGDIALGFSASSATLNPSIRYVGRLAGDPLGTLPQGESTIVAGAGSETTGNTRWGDYSSMSLDPDGCTFWYTNEYYTFNSVNSWSTRIASFKFPSCAAAPANDNFANRQTLSGSSGTTSGTNASATKEAGEPNHAGNSGGASVWYQWVAPSDGALTVDTRTSPFDTLLAVYTGTAVNALTLPGPEWENDDEDNPGGILTSRVASLPVTSGTSYKIAVDGFNNGPGAETGAISLQWSFTPSGDDGSPFGDYDGDGAADFAIYRPAERTWYIRGVPPFVQWGGVGDIPVPGDYNGDGTTEIAVYSPDDGIWFVRGQTPAQWQQWGIPGSATEIPVPADYDGNNTTDVAIYRQPSATFFVKGQFTLQLGQVGDIPVPGNYDADPMVEAAVYRPSTRTWLIDAGGGQVTQVQWGNVGDVPAPGDFNGDGQTDITTYSPADGYWWPKDQTPYIKWGAIAGDVPVPGSYVADASDTDERTIYRRAAGFENGVWYIQGAPTLWAQWGGQANDVVLGVPPALWLQYYD